MLKHPPEDHKDLVVWLDEFRQAVRGRVLNYDKPKPRNLGWGYYAVSVLAVVLLCMYLLFYVFAQR